MKLENFTKIIDEIVLAKPDKIGALGLAGWLVQSTSQKEEVPTFSKSRKVAFEEDDSLEPCSRET